MMGRVRQPMRVANVTTGRRYTFMSYGQMMHLWHLFGRRWDRLPPQFNDSDSRPTIAAPLPGDER